MEKGSEDGEEDPLADIGDNEEMVLDIAERCFYRIGQEIIERNTTVRKAFSGYIQIEKIEEETEEGSAAEFEIISPIGFLEGIKELGITEL